MRALPLKSLLLGVLLLGALLAPAQAQDVVRVEASGLAGYRSADPGRSREEALEAALRDAVEQASGLIVTSESQTRNYELVRDEVLSRSEGYIRAHQILDEGRQGDFYRVRIRADVVKAAFIGGINDSLQALYRRVGLPRMLVLVSPQGLDRSEALVIAQALQGRLLREGFGFVDQAAVGVTALDSPARIAAASRGAAELLLRARAALLDGGLRDSFHTVDATVSLDVLRPDSGQLLAAQVGTGRGLHPSRDSARSEALRKATLAPLSALLAQVSYQWLKERNEGAAVRVVVRGVDYARALAIRRDLGNLVRGVDAVRQRSFAGDTVELELQTRQRADRLAEAILDTAFDHYTLSVQSVGENSLTLRLEQP